jgi:hypothetical protein
MATVLAPCQAILKTTALDVDQWLLCTAVALSIIAVTEMRKASCARPSVRSGYDDHLDPGWYFWCLLRRLGYL